MTVQLSPTNTLLCSDHIVCAHPVSEGGREEERLGRNGGGEGGRREGGKMEGGMEEEKEEEERGGRWRGE